MFNLPSLPPTRLWPSDEARQKALTLLPEGEVVVIAPKTNSAAKDWPIERFAELAKKLSAPGRSFVVLASAQQKTSVQPLIDAVEHCYDLSGKTDLLTAIAIMEKAALFLGNDSGLLHMAAAMGTKSIGLYGPSNHKTYAPSGPHVRLITSYDFKPGEPEKRDNIFMQKIGVEDVHAIAAELLHSNLVLTR